MSAPQGTGSERRRGERVLLRVPIKVYATAQDGGHLNESTETAVVSRYGALIHTSKPLKMGTTLELRNNFSEETEKFRVVWVSEKPKDGKYDAGVEILTPRDDFWGVRFPPKERK